MWLALESREVSSGKICRMLVTDHWGEGLPAVWGTFSQGEAAASLCFSPTLLPWFCHPHSVALPKAQPVQASAPPSICSPTVHQIFPHLPGWSPAQCWWGMLEQALLNNWVWLLANSHVFCSVQYYTMLYTDSLFFVTEYNLDWRWLSILQSTYYVFMNYHYMASSTTY